MKINFSNSPVWIINHKKFGVYLGNLNGESFWTKLDTVGQPAATVFLSEDSAQSHTGRWRVSTSLLDDIEYICVRSGGPFDLAAAGLHVGDMFENLAKAAAKNAHAAHLAGGSRHFNA
jgi:hypothetical protein